MKSFITTTVFTLLAINIACADISIYWSADAPGALLYDSLGTTLNPAGLRIELVIDQNNDTTFLDFETGYVGLSSDDNGWENWVAASAVDDIAIDASSWFNPVGDIGAISPVETIALQAYANMQFYFRWFNSDTISTATEAGVIYGQGGAGGTSGWTVGDSLASPAILSSEGFLQYDSTVGNDGTAYTPGANDGWQTIQPIPEPGTIGLFLIGAGVLAYRKRRQVQQAIQA